MLTLHRIEVLDGPGRAIQGRAMATTESVIGRAVLTMTNIAGLCALPALPLWVGSLMLGRGLDPQRAGLVLTLYLLGEVVASVVLASRLDRVDARASTAAAFAVAAVCLLSLSSLRGAPALGVAHFIAGLGAGCGLALTYATIGRSRHPHRLFALVTTGFALFAITLFAVAPSLIRALGPASVLTLLGALMASAAAAAAVAYPPPATDTAATRRWAAPGAAPRARSALILAFLGLGSLVLAQIAVYSFVERIGAFRGFPAAAVSAALFGGALGSLVAPVVAGMLEGRWPALAVTFAAPLAHGGASVVITHATSYWPYALATAAAIFVVQFVQVFAFALIARLDSTGRAPASTPAVLMMGAAGGPLLGGTVTARLGFPALGTIAAALAIGCSLSFFAIHCSPVRAIANGWRGSARDLNP